MKSVVYALDIGVYRLRLDGEVRSNSSAGWARCTSGIGDLASLRYEESQAAFILPDRREARFECGKDLESLAKRMGRDFRGGYRIALGFEAPMWLPVGGEHEGGLDLCEPRFSAEEDGRHWYLQSGAAATVKAIPLGMMLCNLLREEVNGLKVTTSRQDWQVGQLLLFEVFASGEYKILPRDRVGDVPLDEWDAFTGALAWGVLHAGFEQPVNFSAEKLYSDNESREGGTTCISVWDLIFKNGPASPTGPEDCEVVGAREKP